jgi:hypothetical protein
MGWYPWGTLKKHLENPNVWGEVTDKDMWSAITQTRNRQYNFHSFMVKVIRDKWVLIKATPRLFGFGAVRYPSNDDDYGGGDGHGDGKGRDDKWGRHAKSDWKDYPKTPWAYPAGKDALRPSQWASRYEDQQAGQKADNVVDEKDNADKRTGTSAPQQEPRAFLPRAPEEWFVGQIIPMSFAANGQADAWRAVKVGEKCQWSDRIAKCTKEEHQINRS